MSTLKQQILSAIKSVCKAKERLLETRCNCSYDYTILNDAGIYDFTFSFGEYLIETGECDVESLLHTARSGKYIITNKAIYWTTKSFKRPCIKISYNRILVIDVFKNNEISLIFKKYLLINEVAMFSNFKSIDSCQRFKLSVYHFLKEFVRKK